MVKKIGKTKKANPISWPGYLVYVTIPIILLLFGTYLVVDYTIKDSTYVEVKAVIAEEKHESINRSGHSYCGVYYYTVSGVDYTTRDQICYLWRQVSETENATIKYNKNNPHQVVDSFHKTQLKMGLWVMVVGGIVTAIISINFILSRQKKR